MKNIKYLFSEVSQNAVPYQWEETFAGSLRFDTNTLPFTPPGLQLFLQDMKRNCQINEYADPSYQKLRQLISEYEGVNSSMITVTNSGDEAIDILAKTFLNPGDNFITTPPTYEMFDIQCRINRGINLPIPLKVKTWEINADEIIKNSCNPKVKIVFLVNPNNPTASIIPEKILEKIISESDSIIVVDEVYREFYGKSIVKNISRFKNLIILRSFSKFAALAGARIGYLIANPIFSQKFDAIRFPMGVSYLSYKLAEYVLENDQKWMKEQVEIIKKERSKLTIELVGLGFYVYPSYANFLLVNMGNKANSICKQLKAKNIIVRDRSAKKYLSGCVRITVRSQKENGKLISALKEIIYEKN